MTKEEDAIYLIEGIRANNNINWMNILRIALKHAPVETRAVLKSIQEHDQEISRLTNEIINADSETKDRPELSSIYRR